MRENLIQKQLRFRWVPDENTTVGELEKVATDLRQGGADAAIQEGKGFFSIDVPVFILGMTTVVELARSVWGFVKDVQHGGLIIDGTTKPPTIRESRALDRGIVIFISRTGEKITIKDAHGEAPDTSETADLLEKLEGLL